MPVARKALIIGLFVLSLGAVIVSIVQFELSSKETVSVDDLVNAQPVPHSEKEHIWIVMFDSMTDRFLNTGRVPFVDSLLPSGVSGSETSCTDKMTVPCLKAAFTGKDNFSVFALFEDFMTSGQKTRGSVLETMRDHGYKIGTVATYSWTQFEHTFSSKVLFGPTIRKGYTDHVAIDETLAIMKRDKPDVLITALRYFDNVSHKYKPGSDEYYAEALRSNDCIRRVHKALPPDWNLLVFGDHGHDQVDGRHLVGLDIPAMYLYTGPAFRKGVSKDIDIRSHYYILSRLFGLPASGSPPDENLDEMFDPQWLRSHEAPAPQEAAAGAAPAQELAPKSSWPVEIVFLLAFILLGSAVLWAASWKTSLWRMAILAVAVMLFIAIEGYAYPWLRTKIYQQSWLYDYLVWAIEFAAAYAAARLLWRRRSFYYHLLAACLLYFMITLLFHLPTIYNFGHSRYVIHGVLNTALCLGALLLARRRRGEPFPYGRALLVLAGVLVFAGINIDMRVENFNFRYFYWSYALFGIVPPSIPFVLVTGLLIAFVFERKKQGLAAFLVFQCLIMLSTTLPLWAYALPVALSAVLLLPDRLKPGFLRRLHHGWTVTCALTAMVYFLSFSLAKATEMTIIILVGALLLKALGMVAQRGDRAVDGRMLAFLSAAVALLLGVFTFWITCGMSMSGVNYQPVLEWLPAERISQVWFIIALVVIYYYALPLLTLASLLVRYVPQGGNVLARGWILVASAKLILIAVFLRFMLFKEPSQFILRDTLDGIVVWFAVALGGAAYLIVYGENTKTAPRA